MFIKTHHLKEIKTSFSFWQLIITLLHLLIIYVSFILLRKFQSYKYSINVKYMSHILRCKWCQEVSNSLGTLFVLVSSGIRLIFAQKATQKYTLATPCSVSHRMDNSPNVVLLFTPVCTKLGQGSVYIHKRKGRH